MNFASKIALLSIVVLVGGCATRPPRYDYSQFRTEGPRSILVVPVINKSIDVNAPDYFLATIATPLAERGRGHRYRSTATWFIIGGTVGGATLGLVMATLALGVRTAYSPTDITDPEQCAHLMASAAEPA